MKKFILTLSLFIPVFVFAQTTKPIDSFLGIKFGSSKATVIQALKDRGAKPIKNPDGDQTLVFQNVKLGHQETELLLVGFVDDQAYSATFSLKAKVDNKTLELYKDLVSSLTDVYGEGINKDELSSIYKDVDIKGSESTLIQSGDATYKTVWINDDKSMIIVQITTELGVYVFYFDGKLGSIVNKRTKAKEKSDF